MTQAIQRGDAITIFHSVIILNQRILQPLGVSTPGCINIFIKSSTVMLPVIIPIRRIVGFPVCSDELLQDVEFRTLPILWMITKESLPRPRS